MPIDYSKWDNLDVSSSSEDEDDAATPRVTRLDAPTSVTFGGKDGSISAAATPSQAPKSASTKPSLPTSTSTRPTTSKKSTPTSWTDHGGLVKAKTNEGRERSLHWAQDRYSVTLRLELQSGEKVKSVTVDGILPYSDRFSAVGSTKPKLVCSSGAEILLEGELPHPVHLSEDDDDVVDWSIEDTGGRFLVITLHKAVPMQGLSVWWRRPLMEFPEVDMNAVRGESNQGNASKEFLEAWEQAHKIFREGKQKKG